MQKTRIRQYIDTQLNDILTGDQKRNLDKLKVVDRDFTIKKEFSAKSGILTILKPGDVKIDGLCDFDGAKLNNTAILESVSVAFATGTGMGTPENAVFSSTKNAALPMLTNGRLEIIAGGEIILNREVRSFLKDGNGTENELESALELREIKKIKKNDVVEINLYTANGVATPAETSISVTLHCAEILG